MNPDLFRHGAFSWFELMTDDAGSAKNIYSSTFGWETKDLPLYVRKEM